MEADLVEAAAALRWARPDLSAELADHVLEEASATGQRDRWLAAAGWAVHARAATGDGREVACGVLAALERWGADALTGAAAHRLRIELAMVAAGAGEVEFARRLLAGVKPDDGDPELTADLLCAHARCAVEDAPDEVAAALDSADAAWATVGDTAGHLGGASVALVRAVVERRAGRPAAAVDHATDGLARLERGRVGSGTPSGHLAAALAAEWISALLDAGRITEAREGCDALLPRLSEQARSTRQLALLRLTVTRALAAEDARADTGQLLAQAAEDAAGSDVPDLEAVCRTALGALHEQAGRLDTALEALQLAVAAERRDRDRSRRFLAALAELPPEPEQPKRRRGRADASTTGTRAAETIGETTAETIGTDATMLLPAITRGDRKLRANRGEDQERGTSPFERLLEEPSPAETGSAPADERPPAWEAVPWSGAAGESPIGDLLIHSLRSGPAEPAENGSPRRNGKSVGAQAHRSDESETSAGWIPTFDAHDTVDEEPPGRRRRRSTDTGRRRSHRAREGRDDTTPELADPARNPDGAPAALERSSRSRRRARADDERADTAGDSTARGRHGRRGDLDGPERGEGRRSRGERSGGGTRRRPEEPEATDLWSPTPDEPGSDRRSEAEPAVMAPSPGGSDISDDSDGWLQSALAELDRALSGIGVGGPARIDEPAPSEDGCAVVVDIARDGRRFAGPRAAAVVRSVADLLADRLPAGARSRFGDSDALVVTRAGWSRADATDWMHRTLPGLLDGFVAAEELPGAQLRVAVHDADGPVGAQILQPLSRAGRARESDDERRRGDTTPDPWPDLATTAEAHGQKYRAAAQAGLQERGQRGPGAEPGGEAADAGESPRWPFSGEDESPGRHGADRARSAATPRGEAGEQGRRHRAGTRASGEEAPAKPAASGSASRRHRDEKPPSTGSNGNGAANGAGRAGRRAKRDGGGAAAAEQARDNPVAQVTEPAPGHDPDRPESTEGLGIADLLAGALAAYRGI